MKNFTYEGGTAPVGKMAKNYYDVARQGGTQYGNLTRTEELSFNGTSFDLYRGSETQYYPYTSATQYLVGLPGELKQFSCPTSGCVLNNAALLSDTQYLYNGSSSPSAPPTANKLTGERRLLRWTDATNKTGPLYSDMNYTYDAWGNRVVVTQYTQEGTESVRATGGAQRSVTCYGAAIPNALPDETCSSDGYYTYPLWQKNALNQVTTATYNYTWGQPSQVTDPNQAVSQAAYDIYGRIWKVARPGDNLNAPTMQFAYNDTTTIPFWTQATQKLSGSQNLVVRKFYNGLGELIQTQQVGLELHDNACSTDGNADPDVCTVVVDQKVEYVSGVKKSSQAAPYALASASAYVSPTWQNVTVTTYDLLGRPTKIETPTDQAALTDTHMAYSIEGGLFKTTTWDPNNSPAESWKDVWGRAVKVKATDGPILTYGYDVADRLTSIQQRDRSNNNLLANTTTSLIYDVAGRKTQMTDPDMGIWKYEYDALGNLKSQLDARNQRICLVYDALNRPTGKEYRSNAGSCVGAPLVVTFTYDQTADGNKGIGRRTAMSDLSGSTTWKYDERGRMLKEFKTITGAGMFMTQWTYGSADQVLTMTYPGDPNGGAGEVVTNTYNAQMALTGVAGTNTYLAGATYDAAGRVKTRKYGTAQKLETFTYNPWSTDLGLLAQHTVAGNTSNLLDFSYDYDKNGNVLSIIDVPLVQTQTFQYDALNRLISAKACESSTDPTCDYDDTYSSGQFYNYDNYGRLTTRPGSKAQLTNGTWGSEQLQYATGHIHAVTGVKDVNGNLTNTTYVYDANGNTTARNNVGGKSYTLAYDAENRLVDVVNTTDNTTANFVYDGDGNRVQGTVNGVTTVYIGDYYETQLAPASQRVANPSFKNQGANAYVSANWTQQGLNSIFPATNFFRSPWGLGKGNNDSYGQAISNLAYGLIRSDAITVVPGTQYDLRAYVRGKIDQEESVSGWIVRAFFYDANDNLLSLTNAAASKAITETWQQQGGIVTTPANASKLRIGLYVVEISGWVAFDDVSLVQVGTSTNLAVNAGFESGSGYQAANWSGYDETGGKFPATGFFRHSWGIAGPRSGTYAYAISNLTYDALQSDQIVVEAGAQYDLYAYVRGALDPAVTTGTWIVRIYCYNAAGTYLSDSNVADSSPLNATWQRFGGRWTAPANAAKIQIVLFNYMSSGWVAFDDVSLVKVGGNGTNMVVNPGFETGLAGNNDMPANWVKVDYTQGSFPASSYWRGTWGVATPRSGTYAFATGNLAFGSVKSDLIAAQANTQYDLSVYIQGYRDLNVSLGYPILRVVALNSSNAPLTWAVNNAQWLDLVSTNVTNSSSYQKYGGRITTPANTVNLRIELHFGMTAGWVTFDDISLSPVQATTIYYYAGGQRIARRTGASNVEYLFGDHLGSASVVTDSNFNMITQARYTAWGKQRSVSGSTPIAANAFTYTGQRQEAGIGLNFYKARWYDPNIAHFTQADTIVPAPGSSKAFDRYAYVSNNPVNFIDPTGHAQSDGNNGGCGVDVQYGVFQYIYYNEQPTLFTSVESTFELPYLLYYRSKYEQTVVHLKPEQSSYLEHALGNVETFPEKMLSILFGIKFTDANTNNAVTWIMESWSTLDIINRLQNPTASGDYLQDQLYQLNKSYYDKGQSIPPLTVVITEGSSMLEGHVQFDPRTCTWRSAQDYKVTEGIDPISLRTVVYFQVGGVTSNTVILHSSNMDTYIKPIIKDALQYKPTP